MRRICCAPLGIVLCTLAGCTQAPYRVEIRSQPPDASVEVTRSAAGETQRFLLPTSTPVLHRFDFGSGRVTFDLTLSKKRHIDAEQHLTREFVRNLPLENGQRILTVPLARAPFQEMIKAEVVVDPERGIVVRMRLVRAFEEDIEREGVPASKIVELEDNMWFGGVTVSADGTRIAFAVIEQGQNEQGDTITYSNLRSVNTAGGGIAQVTTGRWMDIDPSYSPDGGYLYFASERLRNNRLDLFNVDAQTKGGGIRVIHQQAKGWSRNPTPSASGLISFAYQPEYPTRTGVSQIWTLGGKNEYPTQLREGSQPRSSPDGSQISYIGPDDKLWVMPSSVQAPVQLTTNPKSIECNPAWSPDGRYIVYVSNEGKDSTGTPNNDIWLMRADGRDRRQLTTNGSDDVTPIVDPQQRWIYFVSNRGFKWAIWRIPWPSGAS